MTDSTAEFFDRLCRIGQETLPEKVSVTFRIDLEHGDETDHWFTAVDHGHVRVSRESCPADCVMHTEKNLFNRLVTGEANLVAALMRSQLTIEGDVAIVHIVRQLLPGPPGAHDSRVARR